jgi:CheY-like chemotaxis protein
MHILIVDDDADILGVYSKAFAKLGHQATTTTNGIDALNLIDNYQRSEFQRFDAVLLDVEMPTMSGWRVLEAIHKMPGSGQLPVVLFTAHSNTTSDAYAKMLGGYALLRKPVPAQTILEVIGNALEKREACPPRLKKENRKK